MLSIPIYTRFPNIFTIASSKGIPTRIVPFEKLFQRLRTSLYICLALTRFLKLDICLELCLGLSIS